MSPRAYSAIRGAGRGRAGGGDCDSRGAPVRSPGAALKRGFPPGLRPLRGVRDRKTPMLAFCSGPAEFAHLERILPVRLSWALETRLWHLRAGR